MTAQNISMDPELIEAMEQNRLIRIDLTEARLHLTDGKLTVRATDIIPPTVKPKAGDGPKSGADRVREHAKRKREAGYKQKWVDPGTIALAEKLGGFEKIIENQTALLSLVHEADRRADEAEKRARDAEARALKAERTTPSRLTCLLRILGLK